MHGWPAVRGWLICGCVCMRCLGQRLAVLLRHFRRGVHRHSSVAQGAHGRLPRHGDEHPRGRHGDCRPCNQRRHCDALETPSERASQPTSSACTFTSPVVFPARCCVLCCLRMLAFLLFHDRFVDVGDCSVLCTRHHASTHVRTDFLLFLTRCTRSLGEECALVPGHEGRKNGEVITRWSECYGTLVRVSTLTSRSSRRCSGAG